MNRSHALMRAAALCVATLCFNASAFAQSALAGTWTLVSIKAGASEPYGPAPRGRLFLEPNGQFAVTIVREGLAKIASDNRTTGTDAENKAVVQGSLAYFGTYSVNDKDQSIDMNIAASTYPNFDGQKQARRYVLAGDELTITNPAASGGGAAVQVWKRVK
jgi:hypothetical protein